MNNKITFIFFICLLSVTYTQAQTSKAFFDSVIKNEDNLQKDEFAFILSHCTDGWEKVFN